MANQIFISYSKKDRDFAWKLADDLEHAGHTVWIDRSLQVGEEWEKTIERQLAEANEVIVLLSANAIASKWVQHEGSIAYGLKKRMYPVLIEKVPDEDLPIWMSKFQYHSFVDVDYGFSFNKLVSILTPKNPIRDLLDQKLYDYETYQLLMEPKELEIVAAQLSNPNLELGEADKRLLLYSAVVHGFGEQWIPLAEEIGLLWLREAMQDRQRPATLRSGAAAILGAAGDRAAFEQLNQAVQGANTDDSKESLLDLLARFLLRSPVDFELPRQFRWDVFIRLARLRVRDGASERWRMKRISIAVALVCVAISYTWVVVTTADGVNGDDLLIFSFFAVMGAFTAFVFAEIMTSLGMIMKRWRLIWQMLTLLIAGSITGYFLFQFITGDEKTWPLGSLIGLELAILRNRQPPKAGMPRLGFSAIASILSALLVYLLLKPPMIDLGAVISGALFTTVYIFWSART